MKTPFDIIYCRVSNYHLFPHTAECAREFLNQYLVHMMDKAIKQGRYVWLDLDGPTRYADEYLVELFEGLCRRFSLEVITERIKISSVQHLEVIKKIQNILDKKSPA